MPVNKLPEVIDNIEQWLFPEEKPYRSKRILWIIRQYLRYAIMAAIHGHAVGRKTNGVILLAYRYWHTIPWQFRKRFVLSSKAFGYEFRIVYNSSAMKKYNYYFQLDGRWKKEMYKVIETDKVYDLIPEQ